MNGPGPPKVLPAPQPASFAWTPFILLGLLTVSTLGGPLAILLTLRGGARRAWPPDRPLEWWTFGLAIGIHLVLLSTCLLVGLARWRRTVAVAASMRSEPGSAGP
jgi:hypothetical protein